ncbi:MAG: hypothetical protein MZU95_07115 [Desulfomicrobium escambiense]|nr:hypothetical protein [Desulfomicrobium escambiense]
MKGVHLDAPKRCFCITLSVIALILLSPRFIQAGVTFSLKMQGGWASIGGGDVNAEIRSFFEWRSAAWPVLDGRYRPVHNGLDLGVGLLLELDRGIGVSVGLGYLRVHKRRAIGVSDPDTGRYGGIEAEPELKAMPIRLGLIVNYPLRKRISFTANMGASCYLRARYNDHIGESDFNDMGMLEGFIACTTRTKRKGGALGIDGGVGLEYEMGRNIFLCLDGQARYAKIRGFEGTSELNSMTWGSPILLEGKLYYEAVPVLAGSPRLIMVQSDPPDGPDGEPRQAVIDFSGVSLQVGIRIRL